ncbi:hypothetical protein [Duganella sp. BJB1802]|uniref:hypothetical protein n=1 Tax=Duganella sp. BJB1802 TaxID=2744575 RepID=UPI001C3D3E6E|nr:hypothetical protein [Duganella sp. BJB1802]
MKSLLFFLSSNATLPFKEQETTMLVKRTQHAIGQGGFHVAEIQVDRSKFRYIYDCGARNTKGLVEIIETWPSTDKAFDWLVISSFDSDHLNCASELLDEGFTFKAVILPHLLNADLFKYIFLRYITDDLEIDELTRVTKVFRRIIAGDFGRVLPGEDRDGITEAMDGDGLVSTKDLALDSVGHISKRSYKVKNADWMLRFYSVEVEAKDAIDKIFNAPDLTALKTTILEIGESLVKKVSEDKMQVLLDEVLTELKREVKMPATRTSAKKPAAQKKKTVKDILNAACKTPEDGKGIIHDYNSASLCLYSGPVPEPYAHRDDSFICYRTCNDQRKTRTLANRNGRAVGWMGVGDITFKNSASTLGFIRYYFAELALTGTRMLPHHGAQSNYDPDLAQFRLFTSTIPDGSLWVAAADPKAGGYRHPDGAIVAECALSGTFHLVSADPTTTLQEVIG